MQVVVAWTEGQGWTGFAWSTNGGVTFTDGGSPPDPGSPYANEGDPSLATDHAGNFYMVTRSSYFNYEDSYQGILFYRGTFTGGNFAWAAPTKLDPNAGDYFGEPFLAVDPVDGTLYLTRRVTPTPSIFTRIECVRSTDHGVTWSSPVVLAASAYNDNYVTSCRVAVGPDHEVQALYQRVTTNGTTHLVSRRSVNAGVSFGAESLVPLPARGALPNRGAGPPGSNTYTGVSRPALAIDASSGPNRGRVYAAWDAGVDYFDDPLGTLGSAPEAEPNDAPVGANALTIGSTATGVLASSSDVDWYTFAGTQGQTLVAYLTPVNWNGGDCVLSLYSRSALTSNRVAFSRYATATGLVVFTLPSTGSYWLEIRPLGTTNNMSYRLDTGWHTPGTSDVGRDSRDIVVQSSADGMVWNSSRTIVNHDPAYYDNALPEIAVDANGSVHVTWYDHRDDAAIGARTNVYRAASDDGGLSFGPNVKLNDGIATNFNSMGNVYTSNIGTHAALVSDGCRTVAAFTDGRQGTPDIWTQVVYCPELLPVEPPPPTDEPAFAIASVAPNPAGERVVVTLALRQDAHVRLTVLDLQGRVVARLVDGGLAAGQHPIQWTGGGTDGRRRAGLYFVMLEAPGVRVQRRLVIAW
jgi:hypothetical protein